MTQPDPLLGGLWRSARRVAIAILAGLMRRRSAAEIEKRLAARPAQEQTIIVLAVLAGLLFTSLLFAHGGVIGMLLFFLLVIFLIR